MWGYLTFREIPDFEKKSTALDPCKKTQDSQSHGRGRLSREEGKFSLGFSPLLLINGEGK